MKITIDGSAFLKHLTKFQTITDEEIEQMATSEFGGLDAEEALSLYLERDFVQSVNKNVVDSLMDWVNEDKTKKP